MTSIQSVHPESAIKKVPVSFLGMTANEVKLILTEQLHDKERLLGKIGTSQITRNALIKQTEVIRKELLELTQYEEELELPTEIRSKFELLANQFQGLINIKSGNGSSEYSSLLPPAPSNSTPTKYRVKNTTMKKKPDNDLAAEIGQGLLNEVRKLQVALQEKEETIRQLELSRSDNERTSESIQHILKQREDIEENLKEEIWNLEVANQELQTNLMESNQLATKHASEFSKLTKKLKSQSEQIEIMKAKEEKANSIIEANKVRHEQEIYNLRRQAAVGQRENAQVLKQMEALNTELKICKSKLAVKLAAASRVIEEIPPEAESEKPVEVADKTTTPYVSPHQTSNRNQVMETETLKQSLAHAHRIISNLRSALHKEKMEKFEVKKMLTDSQENIEQLRKEVAISNANNTISVSNGRKKKVATKMKRAGVARKAKGLCTRDSDSDQISGKDEGSEIESDAGSEIILEDDRDNTFMDPQFALDGMFGSNIPFGTPSIKPLFSELAENKKQVVDIAVNTDPTEPTIKQVDVDILLEEMKQKTLEGMIPKSQADAMLDELKEINRLEFENRIVDENSLRSKIETELKQEMIPKSHMNVLLEEMKLKSKQEIEEAIKEIQKTEEEIQYEVEQRLKKDMISRVSADALIKEEVQRTKADFEKIIRSQKSMKESIEKELKEDMIRRSEAQVLIDEAKQKAEIESLSKMNDITLDKKEQMKLEIEKVLKKTMIPKTEVESMLEDIRRKTEEEAEKNLITKSEANSMVATAVKPLEQDLEKYKSELEAMPSKEKIATLLQNRSQEEQSKAQTILNETLQKQKSELDALHLAVLEQQKQEMQEIKRSELEKFALEYEMKKNSEIEEQTRVFEETIKKELDKQKQELHNSVVSKMETQLKEFNASKTNEISALSQQLETQKKENSELKVQLAATLTKDSVNVLVKRAVAEALEISEKKHAAVISGMISAEYSDQIVADAVTKALEQERQEVAERKEMEMITKTEAEALAKVAAADAIVKERQAMAAREKKLIAAEEADLMVQTAVKEAINKYKQESMISRKSMNIEKLVTRDSVQHKTQETPSLSLVKSKPLKTIDDDPLESPIPSQITEEEQEKDIVTNLPVIERSLSTSRLAPPSIDVTPSPSVSTPNTVGRALGPTSSAHSLQLGPDSEISHSASYGNIRVLETSKYGTSQLHQTKGVPKKQSSFMSISTMSSMDDRVAMVSRFPRGIEMFSDPGTDSEIIKAITQTMIGDWMSKHTRRYVGGGISEKKHKRFFWVHPYTRTLYWSPVQPGTEGSEGKTKSALIESVTSVPSGNPSDTSPMSLMIRSSKRNIKITASSLERHDLWSKSLNYLIERNPNSNSLLEEESKTITNRFVESAGQSPQHTKPSNLIATDGQFAQYDSDHSEDVASFRQHDDVKQEIQ